MRIVPSIDLEKGRSRIVFWPGASTGVGAPTDQPARIARHFVDHGATLIHLVDFDGARAGAPQNLAAIGAVAGLVATPLQVAGGVDSPEAIQIVFATGATRVTFVCGKAEALMRDHLLPLLQRVRQRGLPLLIPQPTVRPRIQQHSSSINLPPIHSPMQRRSTVIRSLVGVGARVQQQLDYIDVAL